MHYLPLKGCTIMASFSHMLQDMFLILARRNIASLKIFGYTQNSLIGKMGIESFCEEYLKGESGIKRTEFNTMGSVTSEHITKDAQSGSNVVLTLDYRLQKISYDALKRKIDALKSGQIEGGVRPKDTRRSGGSSRCKYWRSIIFGELSII